MNMMKESVKLGVEFWNDSSDLEHLTEAIQAGAVGATSNPVIVYNAITRQKDIWSHVVKDFIQENPQATEQETAYFLVKYAGKKASDLLLPVYERTQGLQGRISLQVNPYFYTSVEKMAQQGKELADLAPNITVKVPATEIGIRAMEDLSALGISINATVSFSVSQALASAEAIERGTKRASQNGKLRPISYVTIMVGRVEDYIRTCIQQQKISLSPVTPLWSGIAVFKKAHQVFVSKGFKVRLLAAAYRHQMHWTELVGEGVVQSIPYEWWKSFDRANVTLSQNLTKAVDESILKELKQVHSFDSLIGEGAIKDIEFVKMIPSKNTLLQFLNGQDDLIKWIRSLYL